MDTLTKELVKSFKADYPENPLVVFGEDKQYGQIPGWISTSNLALNWICSKSLFKGLPTGRSVCFVGDPSTGKTAMVLSCMRDPNIDLIIYLDAEGGGADANFAKFIGADPNKILYSPVDIMDELKAKMGKVIDIIEKNQSNKKVLMVIDSMSMISTEKEINPKKGSDMGAKAKQVREYFRTYARKIQKMNMCLLMTAHYTQSMDLYGPKKVVGGGTIMLFAPSLTVELSFDKELFEIDKSAKGVSVVGLRAKIIKSRMGTFGKQMSFLFDMSRGLDPYSGLFNILKDYEIIIPASKELEEQLKEKRVPKKSTGSWTIKAWDYPEIDKAVREFHKSGKFRESDIIAFCVKGGSEFLNVIQMSLDKATVEQPIETKTEETPEPSSEPTPAKEDVKPEKTTKKDDKNTDSKR